MTYFICQNKYEYPTTKIRFFPFIEFPYEGKKLAAYAEEMPTMIYLHMETKKSWSLSTYPYLFWQYEISYYIQGKLQLTGILKACR